MERNKEVIMQTINYKKVKCPKCGRSYFRVKENNDFNIIPLVFTKTPDPIYKDGELQNPVGPEPIEKRCRCLECGCDFRVEVYDIFGDYKLIDEDAEREEERERLKRCMKAINEECKKSTTKVLNTSSITVGDVNPPKSCTLKLSKSQLISPDTQPIKIKGWEETLKEELDKIKERLDRLEKK